MKPKNFSNREGNAGELATAASVQLWALDVLRQFVGAATRCAIPVLPVKGILSARTLYPTVGARPIRDVDVRVLPGDFGAVQRLAAQHGWDFAVTSRSYTAGVLRIDGLGVDVETHVSAPYLTRLSVAEMMRRASTSIEPFGFRHLQPAFHDQLLLQCLNAYKDHLVHTASWAVEDLVRAQQHPAFNERTLVDLARHSGNATLLWVLGTWLVHARGATGWRGVIAALGSPPRPRYAAMMLDAVDRSPQRPSYRVRILARAASDYPLDRVRALAGMAAYGLVEKGVAPK